MKTGLLNASYLITNDSATPTRFFVDLTMSTVNRRVTGKGRVEKISSPILYMHTHLTGDCSYMDVSLKGFSILVVAEGRHMIYGGGPVPEMYLVNTKLRILFKDGWSNGTASFSYRNINTNGLWVHIDNAKLIKM